PYILQNAVDLAKLAAGATAPDGELVQKLMDAFGLNELGPEGFLSFVRQHTRIYFKVAQWHKAMESFDFVVGSRFHGCLIAVLAGVPSFVFAHDARTREMCELLGLPHRQVKEAGALDLEELYAELDLGTLNRRYRQLYRNYIEFLEENRIEHSLPLPPSADQAAEAGGQKSEIQNCRAGVGEQTTHVGI
ncbi:MAG: polysaccharide pyruvyl transferase family protein, partial [Limisphaerales bacterium]